MIKAVDSSISSCLQGRGTVYFMRHGRTEDHPPGMMKGLGTQPLSAEGAKQVRASCIVLDQKGISLILSSPLPRAMQTAQIIARFLSPAEVIPSPLLTELDTGLFTGLTHAEARQRHPDVYDAFLKQSWDGVPGVESSTSLYTRATDLWREMGNRSASGHNHILC